MLAGDANMRRERRMPAQRRHQRAEFDRLRASAEDQGYFFHIVDNDRRVLIQSLKAGVSDMPPEAAITSSGRSE